jgi:2,5-diamino-6-(ribosylamino)-4(3H)-pyrimidinone 5'-phosphate reductase
MLSSIDGRIDGGALKPVLKGNDYEETGTLLRGDAWVCGRTTMQLHFAEKQPFISQTRRAAGPRPVHIARKSKSYAVSIDTTGNLRWKSDEIGGDHLICITSERVPDDYLDVLKEKGISYIVTGKETVHLAKAVSLLHDRFGIKRLLLEGGGNINGGFLQAGLIDEISLLLAPGIDGRREIATVFDGIEPQARKSVQLKFKSVEKRKNGILWIRYAVVRPRQR